MFFSRKKKCPVCKIIKETQLENGYVELKVKYNKPFKKMLDDIVEFSGASSYSEVIEDAIEWCVEKEKENANKNS